MCPAASPESRRALASLGSVVRDKTSGPAVTAGAPPEKQGPPQALGPRSIAISFQDIAHKNSTPVWFGSGDHAKAPGLG